MKRIAAALLVFGVGGCVKRVSELPPQAFVTLAGQKAPYRAWATLDLCAVDAKQFQDEQQAMTTLLAEWLGQTSANAEGAWDDDHLALLESGAKQLPKALELQAAALEKATASNCGYPGFGPAKELNAQAQRRVEDAPWLLQQVRARLALQKWKDERPALQAAAKEQNCITKMKPPAPILYFAAEDETAKLEWLFCDGSKVVASPGNPPAWQPDPNAKPTKKAPDPKVWLEVAAKYPSDKVLRAPKPPKKKTQRNGDDEEPI